MQAFLNSLFVNCIWGITRELREEWAGKQPLYKNKCFYIITEGLKGLKIITRYAGIEVD